LSYREARRRILSPVTGAVSTTVEIKPVLSCKFFKPVIWTEQ